MNTPIVSIIVPVYKVPEQYLRQCVESCINQTMREIEIILVDDGSPDDCGKICDEYAERDERVKVIHKENGGLVSARNAGFDAIQGVWHMYIDGDDWIDLDTCESIFKVLNKYKDIDVVFWKCIQELGDKSIKGKWEWPCQDDEHVYSGDECAELARNVLVYKSGIATAYCKLIRTEYAKKNGIRHDDRLKQGMEGTEFSLRTFYYAKHVLYINAYWNHYLFNPMSISKLGSEYNAKCITDCVKVMEEDIVSFRNKDVFEQTYAMSVKSKSNFQCSFAFQINDPYSAPHYFLNYNPYEHLTDFKQFLPTVDSLTISCQYFIIVSCYFDSFVTEGYRPTVTMPITITHQQMNEYQAGQNEEVDLQRAIGIQRLQKLTDQRRRPTGKD